MSRRLLKQVELHHNFRLQLLFKRYYKPLLDGQHDRLWVTRCPAHVQGNLRLHLSVIRSHDLFSWTDEEVGTKILYLMKRLIKKRKHTEL